MSQDHLYRVLFINQDKVYEVYAKSVFQGDLYGFVIIEELVFNTQTTLVVDPAEEKLKSEFNAKITELDGSKVTPFPSTVYTPSGGDGAN